MHDACVIGRVRVVCGARGWRGRGDGVGCVCVCVLVRWVQGGGGGSGSTRARGAGRGRSRAGANRESRAVRDGVCLRAVGVRVVCGVVRGVVCVSRRCVV